MLEVSQHEGVKAMRNDFYFGWLSGASKTVPKVPHT